MQVNEYLFLEESFGVSSQVTKNNLNQMLRGDYFSIHFRFIALYLYHWTDIFIKNYLISYSVIKFLLIINTAVTYIYITIVIFSVLPQQDNIFFASIPGCASMKVVCLP